MPAKIAYPVHPQRAIAEGVSLHSPAITLAVVQALQEAAQLAKDYPSPHALRKLATMGLTSSVVSLLLSQSAATLTKRIEGLRAAAHKQQLALARAQRRERTATSLGIPYSPPTPPKRSKLDQALLDLGDFTVVVQPNLFQALAAQQAARKESRELDLQLELIRAGARASTFKDLFDMGPITFRRLCRKHGVPTRYGRTAAPAPPLVARILAAWATFKAEPSAPGDYPTLAHAYQTLCRHYLKDVDLAVVHGVLSSKR